LEHLWVVGADELHVVAVDAPELPQPLLVAVARLPVVLVERLEEAQARRTAPGRLDLAREEERIARWRSQPSAW
jgi:hypothetical protein